MSKVPTVAKRNDPAALEPYSKSRSTLAENQDPNFEYQWFRPDQLEKKCKPHEIPSKDEGIGFWMVAGWQVVHTDEGIGTGPGPAAGSNTTDTTVTKGDLVLCKLHKSEYAKYGAMERKRDERVEARLKGDRINFGMGTSFKSGVVGGRAGLDAETSEILGSS